jgi:hypothetical protein
MTYSQMSSVRQVTRRFGDRTKFAVEVGEPRSPDLCVVDLWAGGKLLTTDDNVAYLPSFRLSLRATAAQVRRRDLPPCPYPGRTPEEIYRLLHAGETERRERFWFLQWGETTDNISAYAYLAGDLVIVFAYWRPEHPLPADRGSVFVARIPPDEFATILEEAADRLDAD